MGNRKLLMIVFAATFLIAAISASYAAQAELKTPVGVWVSKLGNIIVTCQGSNSIVIMTRNGEQKAEFGSDRLVNPAAVTMDAKGRILVANSGKGEIAIYEPSGKFVSACTGLANPQAVAASDDGLIYAADTGANRIAVFDGNGTLKFSIDQVVVDGKTSKIASPHGVFISGKTLAISDTGNKRILIMERPTAQADTYKASAVAVHNMDPRSLAIGKNGVIYTVDRGYVRGYTKDGKQVSSYRAITTLWFDPGCLTLDKDGNVLVADKTSWRIFVTDSKLSEFKPNLKLDPNDPTTAVIEWTSRLAVPTILRWGTDETCPNTIKDDKPTTKHKVTLTGLKQSTRYYYHVYSPVEIIPPTCRKRNDLALIVQNKNWNVMADGYTGEYAFATLPEKGKTDWALAPTVVVLYKHVTFAPGADGKKPEDRILDDDDVAMAKSEMETYRVWAWRHSHCKVNFDWTWVIVDEPRPSDQLGDLTETVFNDIKKGVEAQGRDLHEYWYVDVLGVHGWYANYLAGKVHEPDYELGSCYTGFGHGQKPGWWWFPTHEHGHLVHSWLMCSGVPNFAYPDAPWTLPGKFGENFSFLAYNYRQIAPRDWLTLKKSVICQSVDANGNGVPDDDPRVPLDEKRFGWTPEMGGDCMKRLMAGVRMPGYPGDTDTDFEGKTHKLNEGELYWVDRKVPKASPKIDGKIEPGEWTELYSMPNLTTPAPYRDLKAKTYVAWDNNNYYFAVLSNRQVIAGWDLDAANDGWFHGRDNLRFSVRPPMDGRQLEVGGAIWDFLNDEIQPNGQLWYTEAYKPGDIKAAVGEQDGWYVIECAVPARPDVRISPKLGAQFALRIYLWNETPQGATPQIGFWDGEDFVYDLTCVDKK